MEHLIVNEFAFANLSDHVNLHALHNRVTLSNNNQQNLLRQLQTTLDLQKQLDIFSMTVSKVLPISSLQVKTAVGEFTAAGSNAASFTYRTTLRLDEEHLADVIYQSDYVFSAMRQTELQELEQEWLFALRNALMVARLQQQALKDPLTNLGNRRFFDDSLEKAIQQAKRYNEPLALLLLDLDNFKNVNDIAGHAVGDELLTAVADSLRGALRTTDSLFRFGGDEYAVLLTGQDVKHAPAIAKRIIQLINEQALCQQFNVSASVGVAFYAAAINDAKQLFNQADKALYAAKQAGKNTIKVA